MGFWKGDSEERALLYPNEGYLPHSLSINKMAMVPMVPFYRYRGSSGGDHFYTSNTKEVEVLGSISYDFEGMAGYLSDIQLDGMVPLNRYWNDVDHLYIANPEEIGSTSPGQRGNHGYIYEQIAGYCYTHPMTGWVPLYRYFNGADHLYTINPEEIGNTSPGQMGSHGYRFEGIACYILPPTLAAATISVV